MPGISIHAVDVSRGIVAQGMRVQLWAGSEQTTLALIADDKIDSAGLLRRDELSKTFAAGPYRATYHVGDYYRDCGIVASSNPFLNIVHYDFGVSAPEQHIHLPFKCTPWGYSCFRGGA